MTERLHRLEEVRLKVTVRQRWEDWINASMNLNLRFIDAFKCTAASAERGTWWWRDGEKDGNIWSSDQVKTDALISRLRNACSCVWVCLMALISWSVWWNTEENQQSGISIKVNNHPPSSLLPSLSPQVTEGQRKWELDSEWEWASRDRRRRSNCL